MTQLKKLTNTTIQSPLATITVPCVMKIPIDGPLSVQSPDIITVDERMHWHMASCLIHFDVNCHLAIAYSCVNVYAFVVYRRAVAI